jgi:hypothetical protein
MPINHQKLGKRHGTNSPQSSEGARLADAMILGHEAIHFYCLGHISIASSSVGSSGLAIYTNP